MSWFYHTAQSVKILEMITFFTEQGNRSPVLAMQVEKRWFHMSTFLTARHMYGFIPETESMQVDRCASSQTGVFAQYQRGILTDLSKWIQL